MADFDIEYSPKLPEGAHVLDFVGVFKFLDPESGNVHHWSVRSENVTTVEAVGMATLLKMGLQEDLFGGYWMDEDEDDDD